MIKTEEDYEKYKPTVWLEYPEKDTEPSNTMINNRKEIAMNNQDRLYYVVSQKDHPSRHGGYVTRINLVDLESGQAAKTYVAESNRNYRHWHQIVNSPEGGFIIYNLKMKKQGLVSADSRPRIEVAKPDRSEIEPAVIQYLKDLK